MSVYCSCTRAASTAALSASTADASAFACARNWSACSCETMPSFSRVGVALGLNPRILRLRLIALHLADGFFKIRLERPLVQLKQQLALAYVFAFFEEDLLDLTVDLGPDLHCLIGLNVADGLDLDRNVPLFDTGYHHRCCWTILGRQLFFISASRQE